MNILIYKISDVTFFEVARWGGIQKKFLVRGDHTNFSLTLPQIPPAPLYPLKNERSHMWARYSEIAPKIAGDFKIVSSALASSHVTLVTKN